MLGRLSNRLYGVLISLRFAVVLLISLTLALIVATVLESRFDTPTGQYYVYRALWFHVLLLLLGVNILAVALSRLPWKTRHAPFLAAHAGILLLLVGAWISQRWGVDGMLRVEEGQVQSVVEIDEPMVVVQDSSGVTSRPLPWTPPGVPFRPFELSNGMSVEKYLSRADPVFSFEPSEAPGAAAAVQLKFTTKRSMGGMPAMAASQEIWLWAGSPDWQMSAIGPARVFLGKMPDGPGPWIWLEIRPDSRIQFEALSMRQEKTRGVVDVDPSRVSSVIDPGWKAVSIEVLKLVPRAYPRTDYVEAKIQYGPKAPGSAIQIRSGDELVWLGLGDRANFDGAKGSEKITVGYMPRRVVLPFGIKLERFILDRYPGSTQPSSFSSRVSVADSTLTDPQRLISMNEPLHHRGFTLYQSSYEEAMPRPTVSVFSVNQDPGRGLKYLGSLVLVLGIIWFYWNKRTQPKKAAA